MKKWGLVLLAGCLLCTPAAQAREQESPAFWQRQTAHSTDILLDAQALQSYQRQLVDGKAVVGGANLCFAKKAGLALIRELYYDMPNFDAPARAGMA